MSADEIAIRNARRADHTAFAKLFLELGGDEPVMDADRFEAEMVKTTLIAERSGRVAGYAYFRPMKESSHLSQLVTAPQARRTGIGRALVTEAVRRSKVAGCSVLTLNVLPTNGQAIALYERFGLTRAFVSRSLRMEWSTIDSLPSELAPLEWQARDIDPVDDERLEQATKLPSGLLGDQRSRPDRVLRMIETEPGKVALCVFDTSFPGAYPIRAPDGVHALSLLRALRAHAKEEHSHVNVMVEDQLAVSDALIANGAKLRLETVNMRGPI